MGPTLNYRRKRIKVKHDRNLESIKTKAQANGSNKKKKKRRYTHIFRQTYFVETLNLFILLRNTSWRAMGNYKESNPRGIRFIDSLRTPRKGAEGHKPQILEARVGNFTKRTKNQPSQTRQWQGIIRLVNIQIWIHFIPVITDTNLQHHSNSSSVLANNQHYIFTVNEWYTIK